VKPDRKNIFYIFTLGAFAVLPTIISGTVFLYLYRHRELLSHSSTEALVIFFTVTALTMALAITPTTFIAIIAGYFFSWKGLAAVVLSYVVASVIGISFGRLLNRLGIKLNVKGEKLERLLHNLDHNQFLFVAFARLSPVLPFAMTNIALSTLRIKWPQYLSGSFVGMLPRTVVFFWAGKNADDIWSFAADPSLEGLYKLIPLLLILASSIGLIWVVRKNMKKLD
jgi:uncharacterized membrane protein YdjX (TVP38/TMEM64 family)